MKRIGSCVLVLGMLVFSVSACSSESDSAAPSSTESKQSAESPASGDAASSGSAGKPGPETNADEEKRRLETEKWNAYVAMDNRMGEKLYEAVDVYWEAFGRDEKPAVPDSSQMIRVYNSVINSDELTKAIAQADEKAKIEPRSELDKAVADVSGPLGTAWKNLTSLKKYLHEKEYVDDGWARMATIHAEMHRDMAELEKKFPAYRKAIDIKAEELRASALDRMKAEGLVLVPAMYTLVLESEAIDRLVQGKSASQEELAGIEPELRPLYKKYADSLKAFEDFGDTLKDKQALGQEGLNSSRISIFKLRAQDFKRNVAALIEWTDKVKSNPRASMGDGDPRWISRAYGRIVDEYNDAISGD